MLRAQQPLVTAADGVTLQILLWRSTTSIDGDYIIHAGLIVVCTSAMHHHIVNWEWACVFCRSPLGDETSRCSFICVTVTYCYSFLVAG